MYARARWYDPGTGSFLSPDPMGYVDSSNLYAFAGGDPVNARDPRGEQCTNTTLGNVKASAGAAVGWAKDKFVGFMDAGSRSTVILLDDLSPIDLGWVSSNAREARRYNRQAASNLAVAAERGALNPVNVIGGAAERHRQAITSAKCSEDQAAAATVALLDLATLRGVANVPTRGSTPRLMPAVVTNTGAVRPRVGNVSTAALVSPVILASSVDTTGGDENVAPTDDGTGTYSDVGGHHIHAKAGFSGHVTYDPLLGFSISQEYMRLRGWRHEVMTATQQRLFRQLAASGQPNTMQEHTRIAVEALKTAGATEAEARALAAQSLDNLRKQGVRQPTRIPWSKK
jgi:hypothetical protein